MDFSTWRKADDQVIQELPYQVAEWVAEFGSLTQKLSNYVETVRLELLKETTEIASPSERRILELKDTQYSQIREVTLFGPQEPWIYARTIVPESDGKMILDLGDTPLGSILFTSSEMRRQSLEVMQIEQNHRLFKAAHNVCSSVENYQNLWVRRSLWASVNAGSTKLLLLEVFLPDSPLYKKH